jgi:hypothetical protein
MKDTAGEQETPAQRVKKREMIIEQQAFAGPFQDYA